MRSKRKNSVLKVLDERAQQIAFGANLIAQKTNDWQAIKKYMCNRLSEDVLTADQKNKLERYQFIYNQLISGKYSETEVVNQLCTMFSIAKSQAYEDLTHTRELFCTVLNINKLFELKQELEVARAMRRKCEAINDFKSAGIIQKNIINILAQIEVEEDAPGDKFEGHQIEAVFNPDLLGGKPISTDDMKELMQRINEKRGRKINIDDIPFEMMP